MNITGDSISSPRESVKSFHEEVRRSQSKSNRVNTNLISVYNVESISDHELKRLSFAFEVTDRSCELHRAIVLLLWNTDIRALPNADGTFHSGNGRDSGYDEEPRGVVDGMGHIRDYLTAAWSRGGPLVNGEALTSRISRISLYQNNTVDSRKEDRSESFAHQCTKLILPQSVSWSDSQLFFLRLPSVFRFPSIGIGLGAEELVSLVLPFAFLVKRLL